MRRLIYILFLLVVLVSEAAASPVSEVRRRKRNQKPDTIAVAAVQDVSVFSRRRMSTSAFPVQLTVVGRAVRVQSPENQVLPIYTATGGFYMVMRLTKGTNWLNGLPRGSYFINNRTITINCFALK